MNNSIKLLDMSKKLFNSLNLSESDLAQFADLYLDSNFFKNIDSIHEEDLDQFLANTIKNIEKYNDSKFFLIFCNELVKKTKGSEIFSKLVVNLKLLENKLECKHDKSQIIYRKKFSTYFPIYYEAEIDYCSECFKKYYQNKILKNLPEINDNDNIGIGVSGEKDSMASLKAICELGLKPFVYFVDEGLKGPNGKSDYRKICEKSVEKICKQYGLNLTIYRFQEVFGFTIDELYKSGFNPCSIDARLMGVLSRKFIIDNKITKILTNRTEDEILQLMLLSIEGSKFNLIPTYQSSSHTIKLNDLKCYFRNIQFNIPGIENEIYLKCTNTEYNNTIECPYHKFNLGKLNKNLVKKMEEAHPGATVFFNEAFSNLLKKLLDKQKSSIDNTGSPNFIVEYKICNKCGFPTLTGSNTNCIVCNYREKLGKK
ncbi:MAG: hypothetical protein ACTSRP_15435 [Candidatus Helarchaeota archaeon]